MTKFMFFIIFKFLLLVACVGIFVVSVRGREKQAISSQ